MYCYNLVCPKYKVITSSCLYRNGLQVWKDLFFNIYKNIEVYLISIMDNVWYWLYVEQTFLGHTICITCDIIYPSDVFDDL